jgi:peptidoglycan/LPS O-acetylase OafA/YrhL
LIALGVVERGPVPFLLLSLSLVFLGAFLMWHLVEKRFLRTSSHYRQVLKAPH